MPAPRAAPAPQIILAFDFGTRRIGVACGDTLTRTARALTTLECAPRPALDRASSALSPNISPPSSSSGVPYNMDGTPTLLTEASRAFARRTPARAIACRVALVDERLSSREAEAQLREARAVGAEAPRTTHADIDMIAARILLERWFENAGGGGELAM